MKSIIKNNSGSIVLMSILIISAILLVLVLGTSESQITTSYRQLNTQSEKHLYYMSEGCLEEAMSRLKIDASYSGETLNMGEDAECTIIVTGDATKTITITTTFYEHTNSYEAQISLTTEGQANNIRLLNWEKI